MFVSCRPMEEEAKVRMVHPGPSRLPTRHQVVLQEVWGAKEQGESERERV